MMLLVRYAVVLGIAVTLGACGGAPASPAPTKAPTANPSANEMNPTAIVNTPQQAQQPAENVTVLLGDAPAPASLQEGTFEVEIAIEQGTVVLTPVPPVDDETDYVYGDYNPADEIMNSTSISFEINERVNEAWYNSKVQLRLPADVTPGTYEIVSNALMMEENTVGAYVDNFTDDDLTEYVFYDQFEGTITITEIDDELVSGSFAFIGRDDEGHVASVTGAFNGIGDSYKWLNEGSY